MTEGRMDAALRRRLWRVAAVWLALVLCAALTVGTAYIPLGPANMALNILIAGIKAILIAVFFMHLGSPYAVPRMVCIVTVVMLVVMFALSGVDF
jgi:cytochrome c oxidase subunit IV